MSVLEVILLALVLVLLQCFFDVCIKVLLLAFGRLQRQTTKIESIDKPEVQDDHDLPALVPVGCKVYAVKREYNPRIYYS